MTFFVIGNFYRFASHIGDARNGQVNTAVAQQDSALHHRYSDIKKQ